MARLMLQGIFGGELGDPAYYPNPKDRKLDVGAAILALEAEGYTVKRMPEHFRAQLYHPGDYFIEIYWMGSVDWMNPEYWTEAENGIGKDWIGPKDGVRSHEHWAKIDHIMGRYGGYADSLSVVEPGHVPFADLSFDPPPVNGAA
jgi:hypothetical protein